MPHSGAAAHSCIAVKCSWISSHVILELDLSNLAMKEATKEYTVVSWGEENTLSIICSDAIPSGDNVVWKCSDRTILETGK